MGSTPIAARCERDPPDPARNSARSARSCQSCLVVPCMRCDRPDVNETLRCVSQGGQRDSPLDVHCRCRRLRLVHLPHAHDSQAWPVSQVQPLEFHIPSCLCDSQHALKRLSRTNKQHLRFKPKVLPLTCLWVFGVSGPTGPAIKSTCQPSTSAVRAGRLTIAIPTPAAARSVAIAGIAVAAALFLEHSLA